jgi:hypothetical protein
VKGAFVVVQGKGRSDIAQPTTPVVKINQDGEVEPAFYGLNVGDITDLHGIGFLYHEFPF